MKIKLFTLIIALGVMVASCNDEVFVRRPVAAQPPIEEEPEPGGDEPEQTDSLMLSSISYGAWPIEMLDDTEVREAVVNFENHASTPGVSVLYDNYNSTMVWISNSTYYVIKWAKEGQPSVEIPGLDSEGRPGFYGTEIPFSFGLSIVPHRYMPGHVESFDLPQGCKVTARIYTTFRVLTTRADIAYYNTSFPQSLDTGWVNVRVMVPVDIRVEWSEVEPV